MAFPAANATQRPLVNWQACREKSKWPDQLLAVELLAAVIEIERHVISNDDADDDDVILLARERAACLSTRLLLALVDVCLLFTSLVFV